MGAPQPLSGCAKTLCTIHYPIQRINNSCMDGERFAIIVAFSLEGEAAKEKIAAVVIPQ